MFGLLLLAASAPPGLRLYRGNLCAGATGAGAASGTSESTTIARSALSFNSLRTSTSCARIDCNRSSSSISRATPGIPPPFNARRAPSSVIPRSLTR